MLSSLKNNKSLTFYQPTTMQSSYNLLSSPTEAVIAASISSRVHMSAVNTAKFNNELDGYLNYFTEQRANDIATLDLASANPIARGRGVYRAWEYEKADVLMGGTGSAKWNAEEQREILENVRIGDRANSRSGIRGAQGHHQKNVAAHPEQQANPDNIKMYRSQREHLEEGHRGDWHNETDASMVDKNQMLKNTNTKRILRNELCGIGIAAAIGIGVGFTIGFAVSLAQSGVTPDSIKYAFAEGGKAGIGAGVQALVSYGIGRTVGQFAVNAMEGLLTNVGMEITSNLSKICNMGVIGAITIAVFSIVQIVQLTHNGKSLKEAVIQTGKQALFSLSLLAVSIAAQGIFGGPAGIIVSTSIGIIFITYSIADIVYQRKCSEKLRVYMIEKCKPILV